MLFLLFEPYFEVFWYKKKKYIVDRNLEGTRARIRHWIRDGESRRWWKRRRWKRWRRCGRWRRWGRCRWYKKQRQMMRRRKRKHEKFRDYDEWKDGDDKEQQNGDNIKKEGDWNDEEEIEGNDEEQGIGGDKKEIMRGEEGRKNMREKELKEWFERKGTRERHCLLASLTVERLTWIKHCGGKPCYCTKPFRAHINVTVSLMTGG